MAIVIALNLGGQFAPIVCIVISTNYTVSGV
jgi:hypothetical protein